MATILCVDDEPVELEILERTLEAAGHSVVAVRNVDAALKVLARGGTDLIVSDYRMPDTSGLEFLEELRKTGVDVPLIMVTGHASVEDAVSSIKAGAIDYITKPVRGKQLELAIEQALEVARLRRENQQLKEEVRQLRGARKIVGESDALVRVLDVVRQVAPTRSTVLIQGESGTGKELIARAIHKSSDRDEGPFVSINCAALPESLIESSLFGHEKGAFTGATKQVKGAFERADHGTLLLDEISEMRLDLQAKLLRVLQEQEFERVGGSTAIRVDVRIIATTNRDLASAVADGRFREDLYYRLSVVPIRVPPLRERKEDIPVLAHTFAVRAGREAGKTIEGVSPEAIERLQEHDWPGNVRQLAHAVERAVILSSGTVLGPDAFDRARFGLVEGGAADMEPSAAEAAGRVAATDAKAVLHTLDLKEAEAVLIERALEETDQNRTKAAELLGISPRTLRYKLNG